MAEANKNSNVAGPSGSTSSSSKAVGTRSKRAEMADELMPTSMDVDPSTSAVGTSSSKRATIEASTSDSLPLSQAPCGKKVSGSKIARDKKANARREEVKRINLALFPSPELIADFKKRTGGALDPERFLSSFRFRDLWQ